MATDPAAHRCILVPIDLHGINRATLEILVRIARQMDRDLLGLLLENTRLQRVADLPFTTEITLNSGRERSLRRDHLSRRHSQVTADTRRALSELAQRDKVALAYEEAAGTRWHTALEREGQLDIFFPARRRWRNGSRDQRIGAPFVPSLGLVLANGEQDQRVIDAAGMLIGAGLVGEIYVLSNRNPGSQQLQALRHPYGRVGVQAGLSCTPEGILALIRRSPYDLLLLPRDSLQGIAPERLDGALDKSGAQVLVIN